MRAWRAGKVAIANAPGCGVADDKLVYTYTDTIIRYYLEQDPLLPIVPTYRCHLKAGSRPRARAPGRTGGEAGQ
jgi:uncharacterized circularly permuted ATP-grasp superfamily protein